MAANNVIRVADINFSNIKSDLREYLRSQTTFNDYDFESAGLSYLLDILAYNTYKNAYYLNMVANESFLDSAQIRNNVVSKAKALGYTPRSYRGATATIQTTITPSGSPSSVTINKNTAFTTTIDGVTYKFVVPSAKNVPVSNGVYSANVQIVQGEPLTHAYTVSSASPVRYIIPNENVDTTSIEVTVQQSSANSQSVLWRVADDLGTVTANSRIFFVQENENSRYELYFGDGVYGKSLTDGNIVNISYRIVAGSDVNGANTFTATGTVGGSSTFTITTQAAASGGANQESIASIKYNAPRFFESQNRLVTVGDFKSAILADNGDIQSISVWGGEENNPPSYGEVYIAIKPFDGAIISQQRKELIESQLSSRKIVSIDPVFVDATYLYVVPEIEARYDPTVTSLTPAEVINKVKNAVVSYETNTLGIFGTKFYYSKFLKSIDNVDNSIVGALSNIQMQKRFTPITNVATRYSLSFNNAIYNPYPGYVYVISSSAFTYAGNSGCRFDDDGQGNIRIYYMQGSNRIYVNSSAGTIDYATGLVSINAILITNYVGDEIKVNAKPADNNVFSVRNQILLISDTDITLIDNSTDRTVATLLDVVTEGTTASLLQNQDSSIVF